MGFKNEVWKKVTMLMGMKVWYTWVPVEICWLLPQERSSNVLLDTNNKQRGRKVRKQVAVTNKTCYWYFDPETDFNMVEYHPIPCWHLQHVRRKNEMNATTKFGGNLSVRWDKDKEAIIVLGHNKCMFWQYALTNKSWNGPLGQKALCHMIWDKE